MNKRTPLNKHTPWTKIGKILPRNSHNLIIVKFYIYSKYKSKAKSSNLINVPSQIRSYPLEKFPEINKRTGMFIWNSRVHTYLFKSKKPDFSTFF